MQIKFLHSRMAQIAREEPNTESTPKVRPRRTWVLGLAASLLLVGTLGVHGAQTLSSGTEPAQSPPDTYRSEMVPAADISATPVVHPRNAQAVPAPAAAKASAMPSPTGGAPSLPVVAIPAEVPASVITAAPIAAAPVVPLTAAQQTALDASNAAALTARNAKAAADLTAANALAAANLTAANAAAAAEAVRVQAAADAWAVAHPNG